MVTYLGGLAVIALSLAVLMAFAWVVRQRTGNSGRVDTLWAFVAGPGSANPRCAAESGRNTQTSMLFSLPPRAREGLVA